MTMPDEAHRAVIQTRRFLLDLLDPQKTPRVPTAVRLHARRLVKHYPYECEVEVSSRGIVKVAIAKTKKRAAGAARLRGGYPKWQLRRSIG